MTFGMLVLTAACLAQSQEQDNSLLKVGPLSFQPALVISNIGRDPNVFNSATNPQSDFTATFSPKISVIFRVRRLKATFTQATDFVYFKEFASQRGINPSYALRVDYDLGILSPFASATRANAKSRINNEIDQRAQHDSTDYALGTGLKVFTRTHVTFTARQSTLSFAEDETFRGENLADSLNSTTRGVDAAIGVDLTSLTAFSVGFTKEQQLFAQSPDRNSDTFRVMPTFTFSPRGLLNGTAAFGYRKFTPRDPAVPAFAGFVVQVGAGITVHEKHRLATTVLRDLTYSYDATAVYYIQNSINGTWTYSIGRGFDMQLGATRNLMHYHETATTGPADDIYTNYDGAFGYRITPRLRVSVNGTFSRRTSQISADRAYDSNRVYGTVNWGG
jgi:hypothetical protein